VNFPKGTLKVLESPKSAIFTFLFISIRTF
jgi:hypothetical protein